MSKLEIYNGDDVDADCSSQPGLMTIQLIDHEIAFETISGKIECKADEQPGSITFEPGLLYHRILSGMVRG